jgi:hypothetical protein
MTKKPPSNFRNGSFDSFHKAVDLNLRLVISNGDEKPQP